MCKQIELSAKGRSWCTGRSPKRQIISEVIIELNGEIPLILLNPPVGMSRKATAGLKVMACKLWMTDNSITTSIDRVGCRGMDPSGHNTLHKHGGPTMSS